MTYISTASLIAAFMGLFAMMNPIGNTGIFIGMTGELPTKFKIKCALKTAIVVFIILEGSLFGATAILGAFGISMSAFEAAGGIIVLGIGLKMLHGTENPAHTTAKGTETLAKLKADEKEVSDKMIVPLAMPILGGPGSITTVVAVAAANPTFAGRMGVAVGTALLILSLFICFSLSGWFGKYINESSQQIILRFMGMILVAIAVGMILDGTAKSFAQFAKDNGASVIEVIEQHVDEDAHHTSSRDEGK